MRIEELRDIVRILRNYESVTNLPLDFQKLSNDDSKVQGFYDILLTEEIESDTKAALKLYGNNNSKGRYKSLKSHFLSRALNNITFLDLSKSGKSEHTIAIFKSYKYLFVIRVLLALGSRSGAIVLARKALKLAERYELHSIVMDLLSGLRNNSLQLGKEKEYMRYTLLLKQRTELLMNESALIALEERISIYFTKSLFISEKLHKESRTALHKAERFLKKGDTYFGRISYYRLLYILRQIDGAPLQSAAACDEALQYMLSKPQMSPPSRFAEFALYKLENYILLRDYSNGKKAAAYCETHIDKGMNLWFSFKEYEFLLMMQTMNFAEAHKIYLEVKMHQRFSSLPKHLQERWQIFGLHIQYVIRSSTVRSADATEEPFKKSYLIRDKEFKSRLFDSPTYRKDKRGFNVAILTLNILVLLEENRLDLLLRQEEALSSYRFKYLNENHSQQSFILFKLIRIVTKNDFDLAKIEKKASMIEKFLVSKQLGAGEIFECIQILPPQWVWNRIKTILAHRK